MKSYSVCILCEGSFACSSCRFLPPTPCHSHSIDVPYGLFFSCHVWKTSNGSGEGQQLGGACAQTVTETGGAKMGGVPTVGHALANWRVLAPPQRRASKKRPQEANNLITADDDDYISLVSKSLVGVVACCSCGSAPRRLRAASSFVSKWRHGARAKPGSEAPQWQWQALLSVWADDATAQGLVVPTPSLPGVADKDLDRLVVTFLPKGSTLREWSRTKFAFWEVGETWKDNRELHQDGEYIGHRISEMAHGPRWPPKLWSCSWLAFIPLCLSSQDASLGVSRPKAQWFPGSNAPREVGDWGWYLWRWLVFPLQSDVHELGKFGYAERSSMVHGVTVWAGQSLVGGWWACSYGFQAMMGLSILQWGFVQYCTQHRCIGYTN